MDERKMYSGDWTCCDCGASIDSLPFEPRDPSTLTCRDCHTKNKPARPAAGARVQRIYCGDWKCCHCGNAVDELPFKPNDPDTIACRDCHSKNQ